ncbi:MAG: hypothetical protein ACLUJG_18350 [Lawsonibacter sp.]
MNPRLGRTCVVHDRPHGQTSTQVRQRLRPLRGVSRSALEAMSAAKPVIVRATRVITGLVSVRSKLEEATAGNFCCRDRTSIATGGRAAGRRGSALALSPE